MTSVPRIIAADGGTLTNIENAINSTFEPVTEAVTTVVFFSVDIGGASVPLVVLWLLAAAIIFTVTFKFLQVRGAKHAVELV